MPKFVDLQFVDLQKNAMDILSELTYSSGKQNNAGGLFCICLPNPENTRLQLDAQIIQQTARLLSLYPCSDMDAETKKLILAGTYVYVWSRYDNLLQWFFNRNLLTIFQQHLGIESLTDLDKTDYQQCLENFNIFADWVALNRERYAEINALYECFSADMKGNLQIQIEALNDDAYWTSSLSDFIRQVGIKGFF